MLRYRKGNQIVILFSFTISDYIQSEYKVNISSGMEGKSKDMSRPNQESSNMATQ